MTNYQRIAEQMYAAYCQQAGGLTFDGKPLPPFQELGLERQTCWKAAAEAAHKQYAQPRADARDAERWRFIKRKLCLTGNGDGTCSMQALNLPARILGWPDVGELAMAQFVDAAIDAAIAAAKEKAK